jgi:hypothetical protein
MHGPLNVKYGNGCRKSLLRQTIFNIRFTLAKLSNQMKALADLISQHVPLVHLVGLLNFPFISGTADRTAAYTFGTNRHTLFGKDQTACSTSLAAWQILRESVPDGNTVAFLANYILIHGSI